MFRIQPVKLEPCKRMGAGTEIFIVEGDSAAQSVARCRDSQTQAVLPMQGKPLNAWKATKARVAKNELFMTLVEALGTGWGETLRVEQMRYEKILLLFDPDADGIHCGALTSMFFYKWMRPLIVLNKIEIVHAPLIEISAPQLKSPVYAYTDEDYARIQAVLRERKVQDASIRRFRGLANLDQETLHRKCVSIATRRTSQLNQADAEAAIEIFGGGK